MVKFVLACRLNHLVIDQNHAGLALSPKFENSSLVIQRPKISFDRSQRSHANLNVIFLPESGALVDPISFDEGGSYGVKRRLVSPPPVRVKKLDYGAIEAPHQQVRPTRVLRNRFPSLLVQQDQVAVCLFHHIDETIVQ